jgi:hypothetical protein
MDKVTLGQISHRIICIILVSVVQYNAMNVPQPYIGLFFRHPPRTNLAVINVLYHYYYYYYYYYYY